MSLPRKLVSSLVAFGVAAFVGIAPPAAAAAPASFCECVIYVQNYIGHINTYYAKDAGPALRSMGYRESSTPMGVNDIVVLQPGFAGADATAGHIAFLAQYSRNGSAVSVMLRGTHQPGGWWTDHGCKNVSQWSFSYSNGWGIKYYRR